MEDRSQKTGDCTKQIIQRVTASINLQIFYCFLQNIFIVCKRFYLHCKTFLTYFGEFNFT